MSTIFTKLIRNESAAYKVYEEDGIVAILDISPINEGHILVIPHEEVEDIFDLAPARYQQVWAVVRKLSSVLKSAFDAPKVGIAVEGFGVPHAHVHLVPVYEGNQLSPERAQCATMQELATAQGRIRRAIDALES